MWSESARHQMIHDVPGTRSTRDGDTGSEDDNSFTGFFKLGQYATTSGLASDSDKFKIIVTLCRMKK